MRTVNYGLYIHVPCCIRKCSYCDFHSHPMGDAAALRFAAALESEMKGLPEGFAPATVFIGGGTPTALPENVFAHLLRGITGNADTRKVAEWTCEANPGTLTGAKMRAMREAGVNRISLGIQSFDDQLLKLLNRIHTAEEAEKSFRALREAGFENIGADLMYGLPGGSLEQVGRDLDRLLALNPEHISCYCLSVEKATPLARMELPEIRDEDSLEQYTLIRQTLKSAGYEHYEISNFAKPGRECRHNLLYWEGGEYIGCGPSAHSHWNGVRWANAADTDACLRGSTRKEFEEKLEPEAKARETLVMGLRRIRGVSRQWFREKTGFDYRELCGEAIKRLIADGLLEQAGDDLRLTDRAIFISNQVFAELV